jgi:uncharacterized membrane protein YoaK (UPF0700 family)
MMVLSPCRPLVIIIVIWCIITTVAIYPVAAFLPPPSIAVDQLDALRIGFISPMKISGRKRNDTIAIVHANRGGGDIIQNTHSRNAAMTLLPFLAGVSNAVCQRKFDCYATMMTGNTVSMSIALSEGRWDDVILKLLLIIGYAIGVAGGKSLESMSQRRQQQKQQSKSGTAVYTNHMTTIAPIVAVIFAIVEVGGRGLWRWNTAPLLAGGYGMIYSSAQRMLGPTITHVVTGHWMKLGEATSDRFALGTKRWNDGAGKSIRVIVCFVVGVVVGMHLLRILDERFPFFASLGVLYALVLASI